MITPPRSWLRRIGILATVILACSLGILSLRAWVVEGFEVPTTSMMPTFRPGDRVWVNKLSYIGKKVPSRGDVVVFPQPGTGVLYVKRVVGLPGDRVTVVGRQVFIGGRPMENLALAATDPEIDYWKSAWPKGGRLAWAAMPDTGARYRVLLLPLSLSSWRLSGTWVVPGDAVFVLGDSRDDSSDSRAWGSVPIAALVGKVACRVDAGPRSRHDMPERTGCSPDLPLFDP